MSDPSQKARTHQKNWSLQESATTHRNGDSPKEWLDHGGEPSPQTRADGTSATVVHRRVNLREQPAMGYLLDGEAVLGVNNLVTFLGGLGTS